MTLELGPEETAEAHGPGSRQQQPGEKEPEDTCAGVWWLMFWGQRPALALSPAGCGARCLGNRD